MDTWDWRRVRGNSRRSSTSFSQLPFLPQRVMYDPEIEERKQGQLDRMVSLEKLSSTRGLFRPATNCVLLESRLANGLRPSFAQARRKECAAVSRSERKTDVSLPGAPHGFALVGHTERRAPMNRSTYGERDYAFGQAMLTL